MRTLGRPAPSGLASPPSLGIRSAQPPTLSLRLRHHSTTGSLQPPGAPPLLRVSAVHCTATLPLILSPCSRQGRRHFALLNMSCRAVQLLLLPCIFTPGPTPRIAAEQFCCCCFYEYSMFIAASATMTQCHISGPPPGLLLPSISAAAAAMNTPLLLPLQ